MNITRGGIPQHSSLLPRLVTPDSSGAVMHTSSVFLERQSSKVPNADMQSKKKSSEAQQKHRHRPCVKGENPWVALEQGTKNRGFGGGVKSPGICIKFVGFFLKPPPDGTCSKIYDAAECRLSQTPKHFPTPSCCECT